MPPPCGKLEQPRVGVLGQTALVHGLAQEFLDACAMRKRDVKPPTRITEGDGNCASVTFQDTGRRRVGARSACASNVVAVT